MPKSSVIIARRRVAAGNAEHTEPDPDRSDRKVLPAKPRRAKAGAPTGGGKGKQTAGQGRKGGVSR